jgi:hypothetical protein
VKSPLSMNFGRISTSKCRGKLQKMGVLYTHSPKSPDPSPKLPKILFFQIKKFQKNLKCPTGIGVDPRLAGDRWSPAGLGLPTCRQRPLVAEIPATSGRGPVSAGRPSPDRWSPAVRRPVVAVRRSAAQGRPATNGRLLAMGQCLDLWGSSHFSSCPPLFVQVVNSCWLATAHAHPAHTSP